MLFPKFKPTLIFLFIWPLVTLIGFCAEAQQAVIVSLPRSPLEITWYQADYIPSSVDKPLDSIEHRIQVLNPTDSDIVAFSIGFIEFNAFNEPMGAGMNGVRIETISSGGKITSNFQNDRVPSAFTFENYGTSIAFVKKVRKKDGSVWTAPMDLVLLEVQKISDKFTLGDFPQE